MPLPRFLKLDPADRAPILDAATREFAEHGFEGASQNRIIEASGISKGAMYYYFADKADLYGTVVDRAVAQMLEAIGPLDPFDDAPSFWAACEAYVERATMVAFGMPELARLGVALSTVVFPQLARLAKHVYRNEAGVLDALAARAAAYVEQVLARGQRVGAVRTDVPLPLLTQASMGLLMALDRWFADNLSTTPPDELAALGPKSIELCRDLLSPKPRPNPKQKGKES